MCNDNDPFNQNHSTIHILKIKYTNKKFGTSGFRSAEFFLVSPMRLSFKTLFTLYAQLKQIRKNKCLTHPTQPYIFYLLLEVKTCRISYILYIFTIDDTRRFYD